MEIAEQIEQSARDLEERVRPQLEKATQRIQRLNEHVVQYITTNPAKCLVGAVAAGYVIGRIARRK